MTGGLQQWHRAARHADGAPPPPRLAPAEELQVDEPADDAGPPLWFYLSIAAAIAAIITHHAWWSARL